MLIQIIVYVHELVEYLEIYFLCEFHWDILTTADDAAVIVTMLELINELTGCLSINCRKYFREIKIVSTMAYENVKEA